MEPRCLDGWRLDACGVDTEQPQHLEWMRDRPRDRYPTGNDSRERSNRDGAERRECQHAVLPRAILALRARSERLSLRLDRDENSGRRSDTERQHQSADRFGVRLALAG